MSQFRPTYDRVFSKNKLPDYEYKPPPQQIGVIEGALLKRIEKRLKQSVQPLHPDLSLPASIQGKAQYGQNSKDKVNEEAAERVAALKPTVTALNELEVQAQHSYLSLRTMWA